MSTALFETPQGTDGSGVSITDDLQPGDRDSTHRRDTPRRVSTKCTEFGSGEWTGRVRIRFVLPEGTDAETVQLRLYDVLGRRVQTVRTETKAGRHSMHLDLSDQASGVYFLRLSAGTTLKTQKLTVVR